jgi:hypothetical protein
MAAKVISATCLSLALATTSCYGEAVTRKHYTPVQYLKNYALSACIAHGFQSKEIYNDAVAAAKGYKELGSLDIDAYNEASKLGKQFLAKEYLSESGEKLTLMKCIDLFHSRELDRLARRYAAQK